MDFLEKTWAGFNPFRLQGSGGKVAVAWRISAVLLLSFSFLSAQPEGVALRHLTTDDGLSHNYVGQIAKDTQGFMWFGSVDGLTRYDGKHCTVFHPRDGDIHSLPGNVICGLSLDLLGRLWVATTKGLCYWDYADRHFHRVEMQAPGREKTFPPALAAFAYDKNGFAWAGADTFLVRMNLHTLEMTYFNFPAKYGNATVTYADSRGRIWMKATGNILLFRPETNQFECKLGRQSDDPKKNVLASVVREDEQGRIWASTWGNGFFILNEQTGEFEDFPDDAAISTVFLFDHHPVAGPIIWTGGGIYGLEWRTLLNGGSIPFPPRPREPFSHNNTMTLCIFKDEATGIVWIGTENGVEKYDPNDLKFTRIVLPEKFEKNQFGSVSSMVQDVHNPHVFYIGVWAKGFMRWDRKAGEFRLYTEQEGLDNIEVFEVIRAKNGKIWLAERFAVQEFDPATGRFRTFKPNFPTPGINHKVLEILEGKDGRIWLGCNHEGLYWLDPVSGKSRQVPLDGKKHYVSSLEQDNLGRLLVGSADGFFRYDPATDRYEHLLAKDSVFHNCNDFALDRANRLWVATFDGLFRLDDTGRVAFALTTRNGLQNSRVYGVEIDQEDRLWIATANGLHRYYPPTGVVNVYRRSDGLFENDIAGGFKMMPRGELFVGFSDAFNLTSTAHLPMNPHPPHVALTDVSILEKPVPWRMGEPVVLHPGDNVVTFGFAAPNFTQPEKTILVYKLEGFNQDWAEAKQNTITYTNLDGGDYTLLVRARNSDGIWSHEMVRLQVKVIPPFTKTVWFRLLLLALAGGIFAAIAWYRQQQRLQLEAIRQRIARDLHDDMGSTVSSIRFFSEVAKGQLSENQTNTGDLLSRISQSAATLSESIQDIVWAINARHDNLEDLLARIREFGLKISEARNIRFHTDIPASFPLLHLRPDTRRNIYLIFKEAMNNAAKYSACTDVAVKMQLDRRTLIMEIKDNGKGFDPALVQYGNGIANMRQRAAEIKGKLKVKTGPGEGVEILLKVGL